MDTETVTRLQRARLIKTCFLPLTYLALGLYCGIRGPSLLDIQQLQDCSIHALSTAFMFMSIGIILGSLSGALLTDRFQAWADPVVAVCCVLSGLAYAAVPWAPNLYLLGLMFAIAGISQGTISVAVSSLTIAIWGDKAASPLHAIHAFHSVGTLIAAPITGPFLSHLNQSHHSGNGLGQVITNSGQGLDLLHVLSHRNVSHSSNETSVYIPYGIVGGVGVLAGISYAIFSCLGWTFVALKVLPSMENSEQQTKDSDNRTLSWCYKGTFMVAMFIAYTSLMYRDSVIDLYLFAIGVKSNLSMSKPLATILTTSFFGCYTAGRLLSIIYSKYIKIHIILFAEASSALVLCTLLAVLGLAKVVYLWTFVCVLAICCAPTYPTIMAWTNQYVPVTGVMVACIDLGIGAGSFSATWVGGYLFDNYGAGYIFYLAAAFATLLLVLLASLQIFAICATPFSNRHDVQTEVKSKHCDDDDEETVGETTPLIN